MTADHLTAITGERHIVGIDPGMTGAFALLTVDGDLVDAAAMPNDGNGRVSIPAAHDILDRWVRAHLVIAAVVEDVHSMPGQGVSTMFKFGRAAGVAETLPTAFLIPTHLITPNVWKKHHRLTADKEPARQLAIRLWPRHAGTIFGTKARGQAAADAALIALAWIQRTRPTDTSATPPTVAS